MNTNDKTPKGRQQKRAIIDRLTTGPAGFHELRDLIGANDVRTRRLIGELVTADAIHSRRTDAGTVYELWADVIARMKARPARRVVSHRQATATATRVA